MNLIAEKTIRKALHESLQRFINEELTNDSLHDELIYLSSLTNELYSLQLTNDQEDLYRDGLITFIEGLYSRILYYLQNSQVTEANVRVSPYKVNSIGSGIAHGLNKTLQAINQAGIKTPDFVNQAVNGMDQGYRKGYANIYNFLIDKDDKKGNNAKKQQQNGNGQQQQQNGNGQQQQSNGSNADLSEVASYVNEHFPRILNTYNNEKDNFTQEFEYTFQKVVNTVSALQSQLQEMGYN